MGAQKSPLNEPVAGSSGRALVIYGAWYLAEVVAETAVELGWPVAGFVDPEAPDGRETLSGYPRDAVVHVAIGDNDLRAAVTRRLLEHARTPVSIVHPSARISPTARVGAGAYIAENAVVRTGAVVGAGLLLQSGAVISHHCVVGDYVSVGPNAALASHVRIGAGTAIGVGASVRPWIEVGERACLGAGAVVVRNVAGETTVAGNPARRQRHRASSSRQSDWSANRIW